MAISVKVNKVRKVASTGRIYIQWADGTELEFGNLAEIKDWSKDIDAAEALDMLRRIAIRYYLIRDPNGTNPAAIEGKTMTLDLSLASPLVVV